MAAKAKTRKAKGRGKPKGAGVNMNLVKALAHELRVEILAILNERMASPNELAKELDEGLSQVSYHVKVLKDYECIELVKTEPRRGAVEHYYRATSRAFLTDRDWHHLPDTVREGMSADLFQMVIDDVVASLEDGTFDAREDRHMSWTPMFVDERGWSEITDILGKALKDVMKVQAQCVKRIGKSGGDGFNASVAMLGYEVPEASAKAAPKKKARARRQKGKAAARSKGKAKAKARR